MNFYPIPRKGYYIYPITDRNGIQYRAVRKYNCGYKKTASFHSIEECVAWLDALLGE